MNLGSYGSYGSDGFYNLPSISGGSSSGSGTAGGGFGGGIAGKFLGDLGTSFGNTLAKGLPGLFQSVLNPEPNYNKMLEGAALIPQGMQSIAQAYDQQRQPSLSNTFATLQRKINAQSALDQRDLYNPISTQISYQNLADTGRMDDIKFADYMSGEPSLNFMSRDSFDRGKRLFETPTMANNPFFNLFAKR